MDMNASYYLLVQEKLSQAKIIYDRNHMQAQFGKNVLGIVRLEEAHWHKAQANALNEAVQTLDKEQQKKSKNSIQTEKNSILRLRNSAGHC